MTNLVALAAEPPHTVLDNSAHWCHMHYNATNALAFAQVLDICRTFCSTQGKLDPGGSKHLYYIEGFLSPPTGPCVDLQGGKQTPAGPGSSRQLQLWGPQCPYWTRLSPTSSPTAATHSCSSPSAESCRTPQPGRQALGCDAGPLPRTHPHPRLHVPPQRHQRWVRRQRLLPG